MGFVGDRLRYGLPYINRDHLLAHSQGRTLGDNIGIVCCVVPARAPLPPPRIGSDVAMSVAIASRWHLFLVASIVSTSKAPVTTSVALVTSSSLCSSFLLVSLSLDLHGPFRPLFLGVSGDSAPVRCTRSGDSRSTRHGLHGRRLQEHPGRTHALPTNTRAGTSSFCCRWVWGGTMGKHVGGPPAL